MFSKLYARITESSLMEEPINVRYTFVLMLAIADPEGYVIGTNVAIARRLNMSLDEFEQCLAVLMSPDPNSNSKEYEGRRVIVSDSDRGYFVVNFRLYRDMKSPQDRRDYMRDYMRARRAKSKVETEVIKEQSFETIVSDCKQPLAQLRHGDGDGDGDGDEIPVAETGDFSNPKVESKTRSSIFAKLKVEHLKDASVLADWFKAASHREDPVVTHSQANLLNVLGAAVRALRPGKAKKNPVALFTDIVRNRRWVDVTQADEDAARKQMTVDVLRIAGF